MAVTKPSSNSLVGRTLETLDMNEVGSTTDGVDMGVNGCSGVFIWADKLYALHTEDESFSRDISTLKTKIGTRASSITHVTIVSPHKYVAEELKDLLTWTGKRSRVLIYDFDDSDEGIDDMFELVGKFSEKGKVSIEQIA